MYKSNFYSKYGKRLFDIFLCLLLFPFFGFSIFIIIPFQILYFGHHIFFIQKRAGKNNHPFFIIKLRSLKPEVNTNEIQKKDTNIWGKFIRKTGFDELPQLINVLKGEMSFIGPRPLPWHYLENNQIPDKNRHLVKPGLTGLTQINGRNNLTWQKRFYYDCIYIKKLSFKEDCLILLKTLFYLIDIKKWIKDPAHGVKSPKNFNDKAMNSNNPGRSLQNHTCK